MMSVAHVGRVKRLLSTAAVLLWLASTAAAQSRWHNAANGKDVNADLSVWADDVMPIVNCLNADSAYCVQSDGLFVFNEALNPPPFLDVFNNSDNLPTPIDALLVLNEIRLMSPLVPPPNPITVDQAGFQVRLAMTDTMGSPLAAVAVGDPFLLQAFVSDGRPQAKGVFGAYLDVTYGSALVEPNGVVEFGADFFEARAGELGTDGLLDHVGGLANFAVYDSTERLLFSVPLRGTAAGTATFAMDELNSYGLLHGIDAFVHGTAAPISLRIVPEPASASIALGMVGLLVVCGRRTLR